jgi:hypothetical protein
MRTAARVWFWFAVVRLGLRRSPLPEFVERISHPARQGRARIEPRRLGRIVQRSLTIGRPPRCIFTATILYRLLLEQGDDAQLVIGLPEQARDQKAHAWVEIDGIDVGPPPGRWHHRELARYTSADVDPT